MPLSIAELKKSLGIVEEDNYKPPTRLNKGGYIQSAARNRKPNIVPPPEPTAVLSEQVKDEKPSENEVEDDSEGPIDIQTVPLLEDNDDSDCSEPQINGTVDSPPPSHDSPSPDVDSPSGEEVQSISAFIAGIDAPPPETDKHEPVEKTPKSDDVKVVDEIPSEGMNEAEINEFPEEVYEASAEIPDTKEGQAEVQVAPEGNKPPVDVNETQVEIEAPSLADENPVQSEEPPISTDVSVDVNMAPTDVKDAPVVDEMPTHENEVPEVNETPEKENEFLVAVNETLVPDVKETPEVDETPEVNEVAEVNEVSERVNEIPAVENESPKEVQRADEVPVADAVPEKVNEAPIEVDEASEVNKVPIADEVPVNEFPIEVSEGPEVSKAPNDNEAEVNEALIEVDEASEVNEIPVADKVPVNEVSIEVNEIPEVDKAPNDNEVEVNKAPIEVDEAKEVNEVPVAHEVSVNEVPAEVHEVPESIKEAEIDEVPEKLNDVSAEIDESSIEANEAPELNEAPDANEINEAIEVPELNEDPKKVNEVPADVNEAPIEIDEVLEVNEVPEFNEVPEVNEVQELNEVSEFDEVPVADEIPEQVKEVPVEIKEVPEENEAPEVNEPPAVNEAPEVNEPPAVNEATEVNEPPAVNEAPEVDKAPEADKEPGDIEVSENSENEVQVVANEVSVVNTLPDIVNDIPEKQDETDFIKDVNYISPPSYSAEEDQNIDVERNLAAPVEEEAEEEKEEDAVIESFENIINENEVEVKTDEDPSNNLGYNNPGMSLNEEYDVENEVDKKEFKSNLERVISQKKPAGGPYVEIDLEREPRKEKGDGCDEMDIEEAIQTTGGCGKFQYLVQFVCTYLVLTFAYQATFSYFVANDPPWTCTDIGINTSSLCKANPKKIFASDDNDFKKRCNMTTESWKYTKPKDFSFVTEFDLVCSKSSIAAFASAIYHLGGGVGIFLAGMMADHFGRKLVLTIALTGLSAVTIAGAFVTNAIQITILRGLAGAFTVSCYNVSYNFLSELIEPSKRTVGAIIFGIGFASSQGLLDVFAYFAPNWRTLQRYASLPSLLGVLMLCFLPESPRWEISRQKKLRAEKTMKKIGKVNGHPVPDITLKVQPVEKSTNYTYLDLFRNCKVFTVTAQQAFLWLTIEMCYYTIALESSNLGGNMYTAFGLSLAAEIPSKIVACYTCIQFGRKKSVLTGMVCTGLFLVGALFARKAESFILNITLMMFAKFFIDICEQSVYMWSFELFPTVIRLQGTGVCVICARLGAFAAPFLTTVLQQVKPILPFIILAAFAFSAAGCGWFLPETHNKPLRENFEDFFEKKSVSETDGVENTAMSDV